MSLFTPVGVVVFNFVAHSASTLCGTLTPAPTQVKVYEPDVKLDRMSRKKLKVTYDDDAATTTDTEAPAAVTTDMDDDASAGSADDPFESGGLERAATVSITA